MMTHNPHVALLRRPLPSPRWSMQSSWPNRSSALAVHALHLPLQTRFLVRPRYQRQLSPPHGEGASLPRSSRSIQVSRPPRTLNIGEPVMIRLQTRLLLVMALVAAVFTRLPVRWILRLDLHSRLRRRRCSHRLERKRGRGRHCGMHRSSQQPAPRIGYLRHDAHSHPRRPECHRSSLSSLRLRYAGGRGSFSGRSSCGGGTRCAGPAHRSTPFELHPQPCIDAGVASVEADYTAALAAIPDDQAKAQGIAVGQAAAAAILALRADDGAVGPFLNFNCPQDTNPGDTNAHRVPRSSSLRDGKMSPPSF